MTQDSTFTMSRLVGKWYSGETDLAGLQVWKETILLSSRDKNYIMVLLSDYIDTMKMLIFHLLLFSFFLHGPLGSAVPTSLPFTL